MITSLRARTLASLVALSAFAVANPSFAQPRPAPGAATDKALLAEGDKAARAKDWRAALAAYTKANAAQSTLEARLGMANAHYQLKDVVEAFEAYDDIDKTFAAKLTPAQKAEVAARVKELSERTGALSIRVNEAGASVQLDDRNVGNTPVALLRVPVGTHRVRVSKDGFVPFDEVRELKPNATAVIEVKLAREATKGHLIVREKTGQNVRVILDGLDVGAAPWEGDVDPGQHEIMVRSSTMAAPPETIDVAKGKRFELELAAVAATARVDVRTSDGKGIVFIDGKPVAEGTYAGEVSVGPHVIEVRREGFDTFLKSVTLADKQAYSESVTLKRVGVEVKGSTDEGERALAGVVGGFGLHGVKEITALGSELDLRCNALGAASCNTPSPLGGGLFGYLGYTWNPVGFDVLLGGQFDSAAHSATFDGQSRVGTNPVFTTPPRTETFDIVRAGGFGALRVRLTAQTQRIRLTFATGFGLSVKRMFMQRTAASTDGKLRDKFAPDSVGYIAPALTFDAAIHVRLGLGTALSLGAFAWLENAGSTARTTADPQHRIFGDNQASPLYTPEYSLANGTQLFIGPYLGMQFGP